MLWKPYRLHKRWQFQTTVLKGEKIVVNDLFFRFISLKKLFFKKKTSVNINTNNCLFGISIPKKIIKKAVERNQIKRKIKEILIDKIKKNNKNCGLKKEHAHYAIVIIIRKSFLTKQKPEISPFDLEKALLIILQRSKALSNF